MMEVTLPEKSAIAMQEMMNHLDERHWCPRGSSLSRAIFYGKRGTGLARGMDLRGEI